MSIKNAQSPTTSSRKRANTAVIFTPLFARNFIYQNINKKITIFQDTASENSDKRQCVDNYSATLMLPHTGMDETVRCAFPDDSACTYMSYSDHELTFYSLRVLVAQSVTLRG